LEIRTRVDAARARSADPQRAITIVCVTKGHPASVVDEVAAAGLTDVGENRVQEAARKIAATNAPVRWHLIGHLQRNKARRAAELFSCIHSVDSPALAATLGAAGRPLDVFLQVNVSGEVSKSGTPPERARELWRASLATGTLHVVGLMTMAPLDADPAASRPVFRALRELMDDLNRLGDGPPLRSLSMGMSGDFEVAVEEGATHVRIGTALVGRIPPQAG